MITIVHSFLYGIQTGSISKARPHIHLIFAIDGISKSSVRVSIFSLLKLDLNVLKILLK